MRYILVGKAASGKDFFRDYLSKLISLDVSYTSRPIRVGEEDGYTYNFKTLEEFEAMEKNGEFFEDVMFNGWKYGTTLEGWKNNKLFIMTPTGVSQIPAEDRKDCIVVYFDIDEEIRKTRLSLRSDADKTKRRLRADYLDFKNFKDFDIRIKNPLFNCKVLYDLIKLYKNEERA